MKNKDLVKQELAKRYFGEVSTKYDYVRSNNQGRKYVVERKEKIMKKLLEKSQGKNILDVACGTGRFFHLYGKRKIYGIDISEDQLKEAKKKDRKAILKKCDAENISYPDNKFDVVITSQFIEHIPQYENVIKEMVRVCKKGGSLIIDFPNKHSLTYFPTKTRLLFGKIPYLNLFSKKQIENLARKFNLEIKEWEHTVIITPYIFPNALIPFIRKIDKSLLKLISKFGYLHYVRFVKK